MTHKNWTFTAYENGKAVTTHEHLNDEQALVILRTAIYGELALRTPADNGESQVSQTVAEAELARVA